MKTSRPKIPHPRGEGVEALTHASKKLSHLPHLFPDHHRRGSLALRGESFCYFHHPDRHPVANPNARRGFRLDAPSNPRALRNAIAQVLVRLAANQLDVHRAQLMLYSLDIASRILV